MFPIFRELDLLRHFVAKLMENKPDLLCAAPPLFGLSPSQRPVVNPQSFVTDSPFSIPVMPNCKFHLTPENYERTIRYSVKSNSSTLCSIKFSIKYK